MAQSKREQLVQTAQQLFYQEGYHATGIDRILAESGVAKMTLYKHFRSKEELITAVLEDRHRQLASLLDAQFERLAPAQAILATFHGLQQWIEAPGYCGCLFGHAAAEYQDPQHPVHRQASAHKAYLLERFSGALQAGGVDRPESLARQLLMLLEGAMSLAHLFGPAQQGREAAQAAEWLLSAAGLQPSVPPSK